MSNAIWMLDLEVSYTKSKKKHTKKVWASSRWEEFRLVVKDEECIQQIKERYQLQAATEFRITKVLAAVYLGERYGQAQEGLL
jgi:hypothetical protein